MRLLDTDIPLRHNLRFSLIRYRLWWLILLLNCWAVVINSLQ